MLGGRRREITIGNSEETPRFFPKSRGKQTRSVHERHVICWRHWIPVLLSDRAYCACVRLDYLDKRRRCRENDTQLHLTSGSASGR
ncbi:hypothetical protein Q7C36_009712 [Tachysurus vachellii]|uniref:Uncharacterized protein n=1 Tax=Tachysurus vachellii TaxID=175792 RepID=A0AA88N5S5_TACVA|nr:hypothetical protein Q7C36_009712 [Tachysurus vachellii]